MGCPGGEHPSVERPGEVLPYGRVTLRRWRAADAGTVCTLVLGSLEHLRPWMAWAAEFGPQDAAEFTERCEQEWESGTAFSYAITAAGAAVGSCGLMSGIGSGGLEIGYWVDAGHLRQGLATAAAAALVDAAFGLPGTDRVEIVHDEANIASSGVPRKLGFTEIMRRPHPDGRQAPGESGTEVVWRLTR
jgi:ribosomal-protein-serine acetyltransferase